MLHGFLFTLINSFIPHEGNDYTPQLLRRAATVGMFGLVLLSFTMANIQALLWQQSDWLVGAILPAVVVELTNDERAQNAAPALVRSSVLDAAATLKAQDMAAQGYFSHDSPSGLTPWHWFETVNYPFVHAGENLAVYFTDSREVVEAWMKSPTHRANIVDSKYREIGIGTARGTYQGHDTIFVVQLFGTPAVPPKPAIIATPAEVSPLAAPEAALVAIATSSVAMVTEIELSEATTSVPTFALMSDTEAVEEIYPPQVAGERADADVLDTPVVATEVSPRSVPALASNPAPVPVTVAPNQSERRINPQVSNSFDALYSGLVSSSTNLVPVAYAAPAGNGGTTAPMLARLATEPNHTLQTIYLILGFLVVLALLTSVLLEWRHHRPVQTAYGLTLLLVMCALFVVHSMVTSGAVIQ
jgi:hypothetical protein